MNEKGIDEQDIFMDKQSGKDFKRVQYQLIKRILRKGGVLFIHSHDRFGRNKEEIYPSPNLSRRETEWGV